MERKGHLVLDAFIDAISWEDTMNEVIRWSVARESRYICICNVHSVVTTTLNPEFDMAINEADMATPDGAPVAWALRRLGFSTQERINGPDLMWRYLRSAEQLGQYVFFYGSTEETLNKLRRSMIQAFPNLHIAGMYSPPFRNLSQKEDSAEVDMINRSGANVVFVALGCPKQEKWMAAHRGKITAVMIGVGAAFDYHSGTIKRAPLWMQRRGLEWVFRLLKQPRRLYKRYLICNTLFVVGIARQLVAIRLSRNG